MPSSTSSSSLLFCVLVKSANIQSSDNECYSYVVLKIDNVKSTTTVVKGSQPSWEQEFYLPKVGKSYTFKNPPHYQQLSNRSHSHFSDDSDYTSDVSYSINSQVNINNPVSSMSQSNPISSINDDLLSTGTTKKPLAFVQPVIRDSSGRLNHGSIEKTKSLTQQEPLSYVSQPRKMTKQFSYDQK
ncbi:unnamed protein product [Rotaria sp. Silwood1]|nr:unnamed protein product [Rotaria sp. Silwood1]